MKKVSFMFFVFILFCFLLSGLASDSLDYRIGKGDTLEISVWGQPQLTRNITVRPDGKISFPFLVKDISAEGMTPEQLGSYITSHLSQEVKEPRATVIVTGFGSKKIWVLGEVSRPGAYPFIDRVTALEAIIQSGGYKSSACLESVVVIRNHSTAQQEAFIVNLAKVLRVKDADTVDALQAGDIVFVPRNFVAKLDTFLKFFTDKVSTGLFVR
ncbi:MAG: polysaccharide biosynthesis/export family protein [Candidatus Omnitrophica bacterium]|nr:polysaccharide biosynthesis/export family protein [Candidatus Omnitrophota bacterium]